MITIRGLSGNVEVYEPVFQSVWTRLQELQVSDIDFGGITGILPTGGCIIVHPIVLDFWKGWAMLTVTSGSKGSVCTLRGVYPKMDPPNHPPACDIG
jgi:hypothetical protein